MCTIRVAAEMLGMPLRDSANRWLHSGHAMRVTGAQGLARAGLSTAAIMLLGRWGSDAILRYIRKAPLFASHRFAAAVLCGWRSAHHGAELPTHSPWAEPRRPPSVSFASQLARRSRGKDRDGLLLDILARIDLLEGRPPQPEVIVADGEVHPLAGTPENFAAKFSEFEAKLHSIEEVVQALQASRAAICGSIPVEADLVTEAPVPFDASPPTDALEDSQVKYVASAHRIAGDARVGRVHVVKLGPPAAPYQWMTACGWRYGCSARSRPIDTLPTSFKLLCDRCLGPERMAARAVAIAAVTETGGVQRHPPAAPPFAIVA